MKIIKIQLKNGYKRFKDLTIDLGEPPARIVALVGPNGCGKSSVFDGMLFKNTTHSVIGQFGNKNFKFHSMEAKSDYDSTNIIIKFDKGDFIEARDSMPPDKQNTIFSYRNPYRYNSNLDISSLQKIPSIKQNNIGASSSIDLDDKMTQNYQRLYTYITNYRKENDLTDKEAKNKIIGELNDILKKCLNLEISDEGDIMDGRGSLYFEKNDQEREFDYNVLSSGEKEVVDILLDIYLKREDYDDTIYIIDEPELHLNTGIQRKLLVEVEKLIPQNCQLWVATHSIGFLNALKQELNDKSAIINFKGDYASEKIILTPMVKNRDNWKEIFQTALEDLTGLISPETIIYCEGKKEAGESKDNLGLDAEVYNKIFSQAYPDTLFISSGGNTEPDKYSSIALTILNKAFRDVDLLLLKDMDINGNGKPTTAKQRNDFLESNSMNRMLKRKEIENYLFDFEILSKKHKDIKEEDYDKIVKDIAGENIKDKAGELMRLCGIVSGLNQEDFKKELSKFITPETNIYVELEECIFECK